MHRFRKWSDPRRSQVPDNLRASGSSQAPEPVPALPPPSDFRTSLILPDLSRRFSLLRSSSGNLVPLDDLRNKFAEQRARGSENAISQEEEDMLLATLGRLRQKGSVTNSTTSSSFGGESGYQPSASSSVRSSDITVSSSTGSFTSRANKRRSNNLFGSGRFADETYLRNAQRERRVGSGQSSVISASSSATGRRTDSVATDSSATGGDGAALERTLSKMLPRNQLHRASIALDEVIREIEEEVEGRDEGDDQVLVPRSPIDARVRSQQHEPGTAFSADHPVGDRSTPSPHPRSSNASPSPRLPGYIPGMPRPMTPRDWDDVAYDSVTPRATSPQNGHVGPLRRDSAARAASPLALNAFTSRPIPHNNIAQYSPDSTQDEFGYTNGRQTPDATVRARNHARQNSSGQASALTAADADDSFMDFGTPPDHSILGDRMRPKSPFAGDSRPTTPSNITWRTPASPSSSFGHSRNGSAASDVSATAAAIYGRRRSGSVPTYAYNSEPVERAASPLGGRSLRSPPLPDSPTGGATFAAFVAPEPKRPGSANSGIGAESPVALLHRQLRSPTPTNVPLRPRSPAAPLRPRSPASPTRARSPASPVYSDFDRSNSRTESRNGQYALRSGAASPFTLTQSHALLLSPMGNSSRSSLASTGSSYHSLDLSENNLLAALSPFQQPWHDLEPSLSGSSSGLGFGGSALAVKVGLNVDGAMGLSKAEEVLQQHAGLSRADLVSIQNRLIAAANAKSEASEIQRERRDSLKRRRRSLSTPQTAPLKAAESTSEPVTMVSPTPSQASALLESLVKDSEAQRHPEPPHISVTVPDVNPRSISPSPSQMSSPSLKRRRAALADALFGGTEFDDKRDVSSPLQPSPSILPRALEIQRSQSRSPDISHVEARSPDVQHLVTFPEPAEIETSPDVLPSRPVHPGVERSPISVSSLSPALPLGNPAELALEVQRRAEAAMAKLRNNPSSPHLPEQAYATPKKRVDVSQISQPQFQWASTSVETIPIPQAEGSSSPTPPASSSVSSATGSKLGRFKKFRGTLRAKPVVANGEEVSPFTLMTPTSASSTATATATAQTATHNPAYLAPAGLSTPQSARAPDFNERQAYSVTTPPASAGPGLKGFMSRFRKKSTYDSESDAPTVRATFQQQDYASSSRSATTSSLASGPTRDQDMRSVPAEKPAFNGSASDGGLASYAAPRRSASMKAPGRTGPPAAFSEGSLSRSATSRATLQTQPYGRGAPSPAVGDSSPIREQAEDQYTASPAQTGDDQAALKQLFGAASSLGLDPDALSDLLARSTSVSTKRSATSQPAKHSSVATSLAPSWINPSRAASPISTSGRPSLDDTVRMPIERAPPIPVERVEPAVPTRKQLARKSTTPTEASRRSAVVRRTLIMPSDLQSLKDLRQSTLGIPPSPQPPLPTRKSSTRSRRRSAGPAAALAHPVQDRVPTPPPPKSPTGTRFSTESSPPLPQIPASVTSRIEASSYLAPPPMLEKSNSTYDSLYDMYTSDSKPTILTTDLEPEGGLNVLDSLEPGSAVEVLELENGETVWSIVNGLRDDALEMDDSFYGNRASFLSEYSLRDDDGVQVFFKEHGRKGSKDSTASRRRTLASSSKRPETKVFAVSTARINQLLNDLTQVDSGSFNIVPGASARAPNGAPNSYHSESSAHWTIEERIERMLASTSTNGY